MSVEYAVAFPPTHLAEELAWFEVNIHRLWVEALATRRLHPHPIIRVPPVAPAIRTAAELETALLHSLGAEVVRL